MTGVVIRWCRAPFFRIQGHSAGGPPGKAADNQKGTFLKSFDA